MIPDAAQITAEAEANFAANDTPGRLLFKTTIDGAQAALEKWRITSTGTLSSVGAVSNVTADGAIVADAGISIIDNLNGLIDDAAGGSGTTTYYIGNQAITTSSDVRVKTNIRPWQGSAMSLLDQASLIEYTFNLPGGGPQDSGYGPNARGRYIGLSAQETIKYAPWCINAGAGIDCDNCTVGEPCDTEGHSPWGVEYEHLVPLLIAGLQELSAEIRELKETA
jgi:hypothetical protein